MSKRILILISIIVILIGISLYFFFKKPAPKVHYHAGFMVYVDGNLQDFTSYKYMETAPCYTDTAKHLPEDPQKEKAHLHGGVGDVVHVHREQATWGDLFKNINFSLSSSNTVTGYISGTLINDILAYPINAYDSVIIVSGESKNIDLSRYVTLDHIKEVELQSETCGSQHK